MAKLTDADVMTGFNPDRSKSAEDIDAQQDTAPAEGDAPEGEGDPGERQEVSDETPPEREVTLDGRRFKASRDIADAFTREINRRDGTRGAELQTLRDRLAHLEGRLAERATQPKEPEAAQGPQPPNEDLWIENPGEAQKQLLAHIAYNDEQKQLALNQELETEQASRDQEAARRAAWASQCDAFYAQSENKVLRGNEDIVDLVLKQNAKYLAPLSVDEGWSELSRLAKERLAKVTGAAPEIRARTPRPPVLEGSARRDVGASNPPEVKGPRSLTDALKARRRTAAEAFVKGGAGNRMTSR